ncbi:MAG: hypothetical protein RLY93_11615 [Sumerlaeia bacterium]
MPAVPPESLRPFLSALSHLGWGIKKFAKPEPVRAKGKSLVARTWWVALPLPNGEALVCAALPADLEGQGQHFNAFEDQTRQYREIGEGLRAEGIAGRYLLMMGENGAFSLADWRDDEVLLVTRTRGERDDRLLPLLNMQALARNTLASYPRKSIRQHAQELQSWVNIWSARLGSESQSTQGMIWRFFDALLTARMAERYGFGGGEESFESMAFSGATAKDLVRRLNRRFETLARQNNLLQNATLSSLTQLTELLGARAPLTECVRSFALLSRAKFRPEVLAEAFADPELRLLSWRASVIAPPLAPGEGELAPGHWLTHELDVVLDEVGTLVMLGWFDELAEALAQHARGQETALERGERPGFQLDLLGDAPEQDLELKTVVRHIAGQVLSVRTCYAERGWLARMLLAGKACEWTRRLDVSLGALPQLRVRIEKPPAQEAELAPPRAVDFEAAYQAN